MSLDNTHEPFLVDHLEGFVQWPSSHSDLEEVMWSIVEMMHGQVLASVQEHVTNMAGVMHIPANSMFRLAHGSDECTARQQKAASQKFAMKNVNAQLHWDTSVVLLT